MMQQADLAGLSDAQLVDLIGALERHARNPWRPIETAPLDGTSVLMATTSGRIDVLWYEAGEWTNGDYYLHPKYVTHWMPVPAPPVVNG